MDSIKAVNPIGTERNISNQQRKPLCQALLFVYKGAENLRNIVVAVLGSGALTGPAKELLFMALLGLLLCRVSSVVVTNKLFGIPLG